ncbi:DUF4381 domain-containing protein [Gilvimarinus sp. SDUM040013]|uniref:DUF4381 domain-containing protein n=1 Tax=Gilvimarinus gilvus TaxID=3058038 RepID=A0ABU4RWY9_9GAMM|nr:DUF4381 domain-containing protein [Gilvimarinus sp. SDUM040013]MDO3385766.1 DUF4381 domain-containing protein [Gilvimarinus sp. SDUM040013]MDX6849406.1 DUF4381 domain-containing protein [Gilvimarinus sp. SDUM040013]
MDPLAQLNDIHIPEPVSWWPLAPLWWVIITVIVGLCVLAAWLALRLYRRNAYRRQALQQLNQLAGESVTPGDINRILKSVAITAYGKRACASLYGQAWLDFLVSKAPRIQPHLATPAGQVLGGDSYRAHPHCDPQVLLIAARLWIKQHKSSTSELAYV